MARIVIRPPRPARTRRGRATTGGRGAFVMEVRRDYLPVNDQGSIEGREIIQTFGKGELEV